MKSELKYSSDLNGAAFLMFELKQVIKLKLKGYSDKEIRSIAIEDNIFQFENKKRTPRIFPKVIKRAQVLDSFLSDAFLNRSVEMSKAMNIYTIMKTDLIFAEFMDEVVGEKLNEANYFLEKKDLNVFLREKAEQSEVVANWSEGNTERLKSSIMKVLLESGILIKRKEAEIKPLILDEDVKYHLKDIGDVAYVKALGDYII